MKRLFLLALLALPLAAPAEVYLTADNGTTSYFTPCLPLWSTDGVDAVTGVTNATTNLRVSFIADNESTWTDITSTDIETIATIGTWSSPTANTDVRMDECETEGFYQYQFHNDHMSKTGATELVVLITDNGATFADQVIFIRQNPLTQGDTQSGAEAAIDAKFAATTGACDSGTTATCVDDALTQSDDAWNGYALEVAFSGQTEIRCIRNFTASSDTLTVFPAFNTAVDTENYRIILEPDCRNFP